MASSRRTHRSVARLGSIGATLAYEYASHRARSEARLRGVESGTEIVRWERGDHVTFRWKSKRFELPSKVSFGAIIVDADPVAGAAENFACDVLADGVVIRTITNANQIERLPDTAETKRWEIEVRGTVAVTAIRMGITPDDLSAG